MIDKNTHNDVIGMKRPGLLKNGVKFTCALLCIVSLVTGVYALADGPIGEPQNPVKLIFIHHSTGENWLADDNGGLGIALRDNNYFVSDTNYGWGPDSIGSNTDIGNWWTWFRSSQSPLILADLFNESSQYSTYSRLSTDPGGQNKIIMIKSCFPNSDLRGSPDDPIPPIKDNLLKANASDSEYHTVANAKGIYIDLLEYFRTKPDTLFIVIAAPPLSTPDNSANARVFNQWLVDDWLSGYNQTNVAVWDFYNVLTTNGGDKNTNDLNMSGGNHHRWWNNSIQHTVNISFNTSAYPLSDSDDHPTRAGNLKATGEYVPLLNYAYNRWAGYNAGPVANFTANITSGSVPLTVQFTDTSTGTPTQWNWAFGDANFSTFQNPVHTYTIPGIYTVALQVNNTGGFNLTQKTGYIYVTGSPSSGPNKISGTIYYTGTQNATIYVQLFNQSPVLGIPPMKSKTFSYFGSPINYQFSTYNGTFWLTSYMDLNGNQTPDLGEPWGFAINKSFLQGPDPINVTGNLTGLDITLYQTSPPGNPQAAFRISRDIVIENTSDQLPSGVYTGYIGNTLNLHHIPDETGTVFGNLTYAIRTNNISWVSWGQYARWNSSSADWVFPASFTIGENEQFGPEINTANVKSIPLNVSLVRNVNQTSFSSAGSQHISGNMTFTDLNLRFLVLQIQAPTSSVFVNTVPLWNTFSTNAPVQQIATVDGGILVWMNSSQMQTSRAYNYSMVYLVQPNGTPIQFKPKVQVDLGVYHNDSAGPNAYHADMPPYLLPHDVTAVSVSTNTLVDWHFIEDRTDIARLTMVLQITPTVFSNFTANITSGNAPLSVQFTDKSAGFPHSWNWSFGDNTWFNTTSGTARNATHVYSSAGHYTVSLTVTNDGGSNRTVKDNYIVIYPKGDFNHNGEVDIGDVSLVAYMVVGRVSPQISDADFNNNGEVDIGDAAKIAYFKVGKITEL